MKAVSITAGIGLVLLSLVACGAYLIAIVDPVGTKMADDNDPFGPPPSRLYSVSGLVISAVIGAAGVYLIWKPFHSRQDATNVT
ncbi:MAG: hypothetical protein WCV00_15815 [Verrucomicrobiia bacterium]|jgi:hypothetical protein